ncbi:hypothetical protein CPB83DRAFT_167206 [Crepidotus variabilis]|uniref:Uncharacterized protein n=1 Tax=Crepidotus variabilis TaxID=179855 RepID=A0A9P6EK73_9AGAR|nr:hypothetical protein CPB83DRAFT_167206 [Crepidotus variabilis]
MSMGSFAGDAYAPSAAGVNIMPPPISGASALYCSSYTLDQASALEEALRSWMDSLPISLQVPLADADDADVNIDPALSATSISKDQSIMKMHACELSILANLGIFHIWVPFLRQQSKPSMASHSCVAAGQGLVASLKSYSSMSSLPSTSSFNKDLPLPAMLALVSPLKMISDSVVVLAHSAFVGRNSRRVRERKMVMQDLKDALEVYDSLGGKSLSGRKATVIDAVRKRLEGARPAMRSAAGSMQNQQNQPQVQQVGTKRKHPGGVGSGVSGTTEGHGAAAVSNADGISSGSASLSAPTTTTTTGYDYSTVDAGYYDPSGNVDYTSHANAEQMQYEVQQQEQQHHEHQQQQYLQNAIGVAQQQPQNFDHVEGGLVRLNMMGDVEVHHPQPRVESHGLHELQHGQPQSLSSHRTPTPTLVAASRPHSAHPHQHQHPHAHRPYDPRDRPNRHAPEQHTRVQHHPHQHGTSHHRDKEGGKKSSGNSSSGSGSSTGSYPSKGIRKRDGRAVPRKDGVLHLNTPNVGGDVGGREGMTSQAILAMRAQKDAAASALGLGGSLVPSGLTAPSPHPIAVSMPMQLSNPIPIHTADAPMSNPTTSSAMGNHNVLSMSMPLVDSPLSMDQAQSHPDLMNASVYSRSRSSSLSHVQHMSTHQIHTQTPRIEYTTVSSAPAPPVFGSGAAGSDTPLQPPRKRQTLEVPVLHHPRGQHHMSPQPPQFGSQYTSPGGFDTSVSSSVDGSSNNNAYGTGTGTSPFSTGNNSPYASGHPIPLSAATPTFNVMPHQTQAQHLSQQSQQHVQQHNQHTQLPHQPTPPTFGPGPSTPSTSHSSSSTSGLPGQQVRSGSGSQSQNQSASQSPVNYFNSPGIPYGSTNSSLDDTLSLPHQHSMISMSMPSTPVYEKHGGFDTFQHRQMGYQNSHHELGLGQAMDMDVSGTGYGGVGVEHDGQHQQQMVDWSSNPGTPVSTGGVDGGGTGTRETFWQSGYY